MLAQDVIPHLATGFAIADGLADGNADRLEMGPAITVGQIVGNGTDVVRAVFLATMSLLAGRMVSGPDTGEVVLQMLVEEFDDPGMQRRLICLYRQAVVGVFSDDRLGDFGLASDFSGPWIDKFAEMFFDMSFGFSRDRGPGVFAKPNAGTIDDVELNDLIN